jgi:hypothetical protein
MGIYAPGGVTSNKYYVPLGDDAHPATLLPGYWDLFLANGIDPDTVHTPPRNATGSIAPWVAWNAIPEDVLARDVEACRLANVGMDNLLHWRDIVVYVRPYQVEDPRRPLKLGNSKHPEWYMRTGLGLVGIQPVLGSSVEWSPIPPVPNVTMPDVPIRAEVDLADR